MVESSGLLNRRRGLNLYRGFESPPLRQIVFIGIPALAGFSGQYRAKRSYYKVCRSTSIAATQWRMRSALSRRVPGPANLKNASAAGNAAGVSHSRAGHAPASSSANTPAKPTETKPRPSPPNGRKQARGTVKSPCRNHCRNRRNLTASPSTAPSKRSLPSFTKPLAFATHRKYRLLLETLRRVLRRSAATS